MEQCWCRYNKQHYYAVCVTVWQLLYYYGNYYAVRVPLLAGIAGRLLPPSLCRSSGQSSDNYTLLLLLLLQRATFWILPSLQQWSTYLFLHSRWFNINWRCLKLASFERLAPNDDFDVLNCDAMGRLVLSRGVCITLQQLDLCHSFYFWGKNNRIIPIFLLI